MLNILNTFSIGVTVIFSFNRLQLQTTLINGFPLAIFVAFALAFPQNKILISYQFINKKKI